MEEHSLRKPASRAVDNLVSIKTVCHTGMWISIVEFKRHSVRIFSMLVRMPP
jgi:hypothetical protein